MSPTILIPAQLDCSECGTKMPIRAELHAWECPDCGTIAGPLSFWRPDMPHSGPLVPCPPLPIGAGLR